MLSGKILSNASSRSYRILGGVVVNLVEILLDAQWEDSFECFVENLLDTQWGGGELG